MSMQGRNWLYLAYLALSARGDLTERKGRELLKKTFPNSAFVLDDVIAARGDDSKIKPEKLSLLYDELAAEDSGMAAGAMNANIRQQAHGETIQTPEDMNKAIRSSRDEFLDGLFDAYEGKETKPDNPLDHPVNAAIRKRAGLATGQRS